MGAAVPANTNNSQLVHRLSYERGARVIAVYKHQLFGFEERNDCVNCSSWEFPSFRKRLIQIERIPA